MLRQFRLLARRQQQILQTNVPTKQQPTVKKLEYQDFLKSYRWQNYRNTKNTK